VSEPSVSNSTTPRLDLGRPVPNFTLPAVAGGSVTRSVYRARKHLALIFLPFVDLPAREYLEALRDSYTAVREADSELLAIVTDAASSAEGLRAALDLPFPLLLDPNGAVAQRFLPDGAVMGVLILDRYAKLHAQWTLTRPPLPPVTEIVEWLEATDRVCVL
jgi:peroxiredoxin